MLDLFWLITVLFQPDVVPFPYPIPERCRCHH